MCWVFSDASVCEAHGAYEASYLQPDSGYRGELLFSIPWVDSSEAHPTRFPRKCHRHQAPTAHSGGQLGNTSLYWLSSFPVSFYPLPHSCSLRSLLKMNCPHANPVWALLTGLQQIDFFTTNVMGRNTLFSICNMKFPLLLCNGREGYLFSPR